MFDRIPLSLLALVLACGPVGSDTAGTSETGEDSTSVTGNETEQTPTTGGEMFPMCQEPLGREDVGFVFSSDTLNDFDMVDVQCTVDGNTNDVPEVSAALDLTCTGADSVMHKVRIELRLFDDDPQLAVFDAAQVRLVHYRVDSFTQREVLVLRGTDDGLLLYAGVGYDLLNAEDVALRAPFTYTPVADELCVTEVLGECDTRRRSAIDVVLGAVSQRLFDRDEASFDGFAAHLGEAVVFDRYAKDDCFGDSIDGLEARIVVYADK